MVLIRKVEVMQFEGMQTVSASLLMKLSTSILILYAGYVTFTYSFHDPMTNMYFWHPAYDNYPVVGVTWVQAKAFSVWRTQLLNGLVGCNGRFVCERFPFAY